MISEEGISTRVILVFLVTLYNGFPSNGFVLGGPHSNGFPWRYGDAILVDTYLICKWFKEILGAIVFDVHPLFSFF